ncbi:MAG: hypothetical protein IGR92_03720 [Leptolyngbyaceae cyanobacterium T60_A2020_046]|nr:hypothetical protein [Leptolyngbyaceae cyanobacterium T60_A2020_046]
MTHRTPQRGFNHWEDAQDLDQVVSDKRTAKRAGRAKARRRNRRYENRLLRASLEEGEIDLAGDRGDENSLA